MFLEFYHNQFFNNDDKIFNGSHFLAQLMPQADCQIENDVVESRSNSGKHNESL